MSGEPTKTRRIARLLLNFAGFAVVLIIWRWTIHAHLPLPVLAAIALVGLALVPVVSWVGRRSLDRRPTAEHAARVTSIVHYSIMLLLGAAIVGAIRAGVAWPGWVLPIPAAFGLALMWVFGVILAATVLNLAVRGLGAPFAIALSRRLASDWLYVRTRNPMVLACLLYLVAAALWLRSGTLLAWAVLGASPAWIAVVKLYEERELEIRFGPSYLEYKSRTPLLFPRLRRPHAAGG